MWTLSCLQMHPHPLIVVDEDATLELQVKTVKVAKPPQHLRQHQH
jgi:glucosamine-6-phosphate deaminase